MMLAARDTGRAREALDALGVAGLLAVRPAMPSTGQGRHVPVARAVAAGPSLLVVDEPEGATNAEALRCWRDVMVEAIGGGGPIIVVAVHRSLALESTPVLTISLRAAPSGSTVRFDGLVEML
jgi:putative ABC transport system ATP-binding protein